MVVVNEQLQIAIWTVACRVLREASQKIEWADYPEIGEDDWYAVQDAVDQIVEGGVMAVNPADYETAYALLESRADHSVGF